MRRVLGWSTLGGEVLVVLFWALYFAGAISLGREPEAAAFEAAFPVADDALAAVLILASRELLRGSAAGPLVLSRDRFVEVAASRSWRPLELGEVIVDSGLHLCLHGTEATLDTGRVRNLFESVGGAVGGYVAALLEMDRLAAGIRLTPV